MVKASAESSPDAGAFLTTRWSVVLQAKGESAAAREALETLCRTYWWPLYGFVRRHGYSPEEAQDLTQGFFALLLERKDFEAVRREKGRLRSYLLTALKHHLAKAHRHATTLKRGEGRALVPLEELLARERGDLEPADLLTPDRVYERRWARALLEQVIARLRDEYHAAGNIELFDQLRQLLTEDPGKLPQAQVAQQLGMTANAVKQAYYRLRERYRLLLVEEIGHTLATPQEVEDELRHFIAVLQS